MSKHLILGRKGEAIAGDYLSRLGYQILERNWRYKRAEVDIICLDQEDLVFVEVKTRSYIHTTKPENAVNRRKQQLLIAAAAQYMRAIDHDWAFRFDIIALIHDSNQQYHIKHLENAFEP